MLMGVSTAAALAGVAAAFVLYRRDAALAARLANKFPAVYRLLLRKWYVDELYHSAIVRPLWLLGRAAVAIDRFVIDGLIWVITAVPRLSGIILRTTQSGRLASYATAMVIGIVLLILWVLSRQ